MRTGANFARGSCRALKWMTVFGVLLVLGSAQALAQPTVEHARYDNVGTTVTVTMSAEVSATGSSDLPGTLFTFPGTTHIVSGTTNLGQTGQVTFTLTVSPALTQSATLHYTPPTAPAAQRMVDDGPGGLPVNAFNTLVESASPSIPQLVANVQIQTNIFYTGTALPEATGGTPPFVYSLMVTPVGGSAQPIESAIPGLTFNATTRVISGTPTAAAVGRHRATYTATGGVGTGTVDFYIEVTAGPAAGSATGQVTAVGIEGSTSNAIGSDTRLHVIEGALTNVTVTGRWTNAQLTQLWGTRLPANPPDPAQVTIAVASVLVTGDDWLSPAETNERPGDAQFGGRGRGPRDDHGHGSHSGQADGEHRQQPARR